MINHLIKNLKIDLRYKWLWINYFIGTFFMLASYIFISNPTDQVNVLKGMLCWYGINQCFFGVAGFMVEERIEGTFENLFVYPIKISEYIFAKGLQVMIETFGICVFQIIMFSFFDIKINDLAVFLLILIVNNLIAFNMSCVFLVISIKYKRLGSVNYIIQQLLGTLSGYSVDIKKYPKLIAMLSYIIPITYTIQASRESFSLISMILVFIGFLLSMILITICFPKILNSIKILRKKGEINQW
ncbi:ABC transporter permease [Anaerorhabdus sp.]|uniref:ABC transporter permease n=1 Tax=Anaerorhabdus sp. TaxID=1872524 RepID=UPI002B2200BF|nr:ABC transporter permease [Anaerorhabdus sp.]MEA4875088.1 ABC transporter permease [Anaerorhabdus sp.]